MIYDLNRSELSEIAKLSNIDVDSLRKRLDMEDVFKIIVVFEDRIKIRTKSGSELILNLKE